jgi:RimJ/RimL family protein N-acetyltransferase/8-oxo-dGTP pyrophosphatase MutT (NUDIX family)
VVDRLRSHEVTLVDGDLVLRPMTENDWDAVLSWSNDPQVIWFSEGDRVESRSREQVQAIYRGVSHTPADLFIFEVSGTPVGDGWLQQMNLPRLLQAFPDRDCRRIDLQLARGSWGQGIGTRAIRLLTAHGFQAGADLVFACDIGAENDRSLRAFKANCFVPWRLRAQPADSKWSHTWDLVCRSEYFFGHAPAKGRSGPDQVMAADAPFGASVVVYRRDPELRILMLHRSVQGPHYEGDWAWTPPAGARFPAEPIEECACRELSEEIKMEVSPADLTLVDHLEWWTYRLVLPPGVDIVLDEEHDRFEWLAPEEALARCQPEAPRGGLARAISSIQSVG